MRHLFTILILLLIPELYIQAERYVLLCRNDVLVKSEYYLIKQVGVKEHGHNSGTQVESYLASVGLKAGNPYCMAGQYWCFYMAVREMQLSLNEIPIPRQGMAQGAYSYALKYGRKTAFNPARHDLLVWRLGRTSSGHIERIISVQQAGWVTTVGFNTGSDTRDGEGVARKTRNIYHPIGRLLVKGLVGFIKK